MDAGWRKIECAVVGSGQHLPSKAWSFTAVVSQTRLSGKGGWFNIFLDFRVCMYIKVNMEVFLICWSSCMPEISIVLAIYTQHFLAFTHEKHCCSFICIRSWKYNKDVSEFYIETDEKTSKKLAELDKVLEQTELDDTWPQHIYI